MRNNELNPSLTPAPLMEVINGAWEAKVLTVATELKLFSVIADKGTVDLLEVAEMLCLQVRPTEMLLNCCVALSLLKKDNNRYRNTPLTEKFLVRGKPTYFGDIIVMLGTREYDAWSDLKRAVENNKPVSLDIVGLTATSNSAKQFTKAMHNNAIAPAIALSKLLDLSHSKCLLDLGGGSGAYSIILTKEFKHLKAIVFDFPNVCEVTREYIDAMGASSNVTVQSGDFWTDELPKGADIVLLGQVMHSFSDKQNKVLLEMIHDYLPNGGLLIITEFLLNKDKTGPPFAALFGLNMLIASECGKTYTEGEVRRLLQHAGFINMTSQIPLIGPHSLIYGKKK